MLCCISPDTGCAFRPVRFVFLPFPRESGGSRRRSGDGNAARRRNPDLCLFPDPAAVFLLHFHSDSHCAALHVPHGGGSMENISPDCPSCPRTAGSLCALFPVHVHSERPDHVWNQRVPDSGLLLSLRDSADHFGDSLSVGGSVSAGSGVQPVFHSVFLC